MKAGGHDDDERASMRSISIVEEGLWKKATTILYQQP